MIVSILFCMLFGDNSLMSRIVNWNSVFKIYIPVNVNVSVIESDDARV